MVGAACELTAMTRALPSTPGWCWGPGQIGRGVGLDAVLHGAAGDPRVTWAGDRGSRRGGVPGRARGAGWGGRGTGGRGGRGAGGWGGGGIGRAWVWPHALARRRDRRVTAA